MDRTGSFYLPNAGSIPAGSTKLPIKICYNKNMKKILYILLIVIVLALAAYWYFVYRTPTEKQPTQEETANTVQEMADTFANTIASSVSAVAVPNAAEKISQETNPVEKSNPFTDLKTNPFE